MFISNNLSIIDETERSDVMAASISATNKWLLTKQACALLNEDIHETSSHTRAVMEGGVQRVKWEILDIHYMQFGLDASDDMEEMRVVGKVNDTGSITYPGKNEGAAKSK